jgi:hypothetical protein
MWNFTPEGQNNAFLLVEKEEREDLAQLLSVK